MQEILQQHPVVEERLWRVSGIRTALQLLPQLPEYQVSGRGSLPCKQRGQDPYYVGKVCHSLGGCKTVLLAFFVCIGIV